VEDAHALIHRWIERDASWQLLQFAEALRGNLALPIAHQHEAMPFDGEGAFAACMGDFDADTLGGKRADFGGRLGGG
jgi:hypothetical protein